MRQREQALQQPHLLGVDGFRAGVGHAQSLTLIFHKERKKKCPEIFF